MVSKEALLWVRKTLSSKRVELGDVWENMAEWFFENGVELIDELLAHREKDKLPEQ